MLRITKLEMQQIGPFGDLTLEFPEKPKGMEDKAEIHILTGENGTGKSTVLEMLAALIQFVQYRNIVSKVRDKDFFSVKLKLSNQEEALIFKNPNENSAKSIPASVQKYIKAFDNHNQIPFGIAFFAYSGHRFFDHVSITGIKEIKSHPFENALDFRQSVNPENILQWVANNIAGSFIAQGRGETQQAENFRRSVKKLEKAISDIIQKDIQFHLEYNPYGVSIKVNQEQLDFNQLPDGLKSIISWLSDLVMRMDRVKWENDTPVFERNFILFLDEIEVHMHPAWQRKILPVVQRLFPNAQIFISTHSPFVVGSVDGAWIHKLVKPNGDSKLAEGYPKLSEDGNSFRYWLDEVFDVSAEFGIDVENQLKEFYALRDKVLKSDAENLHAELIKKGRELAEQSAELHQIIEMELRQVNRRKSLSLSI